jgi:hypothetical protein
MNMFVYMCIHTFVFVPIDTIIVPVNAIFFVSHPCIMYANTVLFQ